MRQFRATVGIEPPVSLATKPSIAKCFAPASPAAISRRVNAIQNQLINRAKMPAQSGDAQFGEQIS